MGKKEEELSGTMSQREKRIVALYSRACLRRTGREQRIEPDEKRSTLLSALSDSTALTV
jgi:hypothetical protein